MGEEDVKHDLEEKGTFMDGVTKSEINPLCELYIMHRSVPCTRDSEADLTYSCADDASMMMLDADGRHSDGLT